MKILISAGIFFSAVAAVFAALDETWYFFWTSLFFCLANIWFYKVACKVEKDME